MLNPLEISVSYTTAGVARISCGNGKPIFRIGPACTKKTLIFVWILIQRVLFVVWLPGCLEGAGRITLPHSDQRKK